MPTDETPRQRRERLRRARRAGSDTPKNSPVNPTPPRPRLEIGDRAFVRDFTSSYYGLDGIITAVERGRTPTKDRYTMTIGRDRGLQFLGKQIKRKRLPTERGSATVNLIWCVIAVVGIAAAAQLLFGYDSTGLFDRAKGSVVAGIQDAANWVGRRLTR